MSFPNIAPSSRRFTPGDWPVKTFNSANGSEFRILRGSNRVNAKLELEYKNLPDKNVGLFLQDYYARQGTFKSWKFEPKASRSIFDGWDASRGVKEGDSTLLEGSVYGMQWRYEQEPEVQQVAPGVSNVTVRLIGIIQSTLPSVDITPITPIIPAVPVPPPPLLDKRILVDAVFLRESEGAAVVGGLTVGGGLKLAYYGKPVRGQNRTPGINWATDNSWTVAELNQISTWRIYCYADIVDEVGRTEPELQIVDGRGSSLRRHDWFYPEGAKFITVPSYGFDPLDRFVKDNATKSGDEKNRQTLWEVENIPTDDIVTSGPWTRREKSLPDGATAFPTASGNNWTGATVRTPDNNDTWSFKGSAFQATYPGWNSTIGWSGPQRANFRSPTRYFLVVLALNSEGKLLSLGGITFHARFDLPPAG